MFGSSEAARHGAEERTLQEDEAVRIPRRGRATVVRVERGTVLVTCQGDLEDHVLEPGDELLLPRGGLAVAWAFTPARISWRPLEPSARLAVLAAEGLGAVRLEPVRAVVPLAGRGRASGTGR